MNRRLAIYFTEALFAQPSLEATAALEELEYIFYAKVEDFSQMSQADSAERQEQWSVFLTNNTGVEANVRVRAVNDKSYTLTSKFYIPNAKGKWEVEREVEKDHFDLMRSLAEGGMIKERYRFPVEGHDDLTWEVDVHYDTNGNRFDWVRVELEVPGKLDSIPPLPIQASETIMRQPKHQTDEERAFVKDLYDNHYLQKPPRSSNEDLDSEDQGIVAAPSGEKPVDEENDEEVVSDDVKLNSGVDDDVVPDDDNSGESEEPEKDDDAEKDPDDDDDTNDDKDEESEEESESEEKEEA